MIPTEKPKKPKVKRTVTAIVTTHFSTESRRKIVRKRMVFEKREVPRYGFWGI